MLDVRVKHGGHFIQMAEAVGPAGRVIGFEAAPEMCRRTFEWDNQLQLRSTNPHPIYRGASLLDLASSVGKSASGSSRSATRTHGRRSTLDHAPTRLCPNSIGK
jgi:hypothetical protein